MKVSGIFSVFMVFMVSLVLVSPSFSEVTYVGKITNIEGKVGIGRKGSSKLIKAKSGGNLFAGDNLITGVKSKAQITLRDNSRIYVAQNSKMRIGAFLLKKDTEKRHVMVHAFRGMYKFAVTKIMKAAASGEKRPWANSSYTVKTPTAVVGVKGTVWLLDVTTKEKTGVTVLDGVVSLKNSNPAIKGEVFIGKDNAAVVVKGDVPTVPTPAAPEVIQAMVEDTTPEETTDATTELAFTGDADVEAEEIIATEETIVEGEETITTAELSAAETTTTTTTTTETTTTAATTDTTAVFGFEAPLTDTTTTTTTTTTTGTTVVSGGGGTTCASAPCI